MIIATTTALILYFGGSSGSIEHFLLDIKKPVKTSVQSKAVSKELIKISKELGKDLKKQNKRLGKLQSSFLDLHVQHDATLKTCTDLIDRMIEIQRAGQKQILDARFAMREHVTAEEWRILFRRDEKQEEKQAEKPKAEEPSR